MKVLMKFVYLILLSPERSCSIICFPPIFNHEDTFISSSNLNKDKNNNRLFSGYHNQQSESSHNVKDLSLSVSSEVAILFYPYRDKLSLTAVVARFLHNRTSYFDRLQIQFVNYIIAIWELLESILCVILISLMKTCVC